MVAADGGLAAERAHADGFKSGYNKAMGEMAGLHFPGEMRALAEQVAKIIGGAKFHPSKPLDIPERARTAQHQHVKHKPSPSVSAERGLPRAQQRVVDALGFWISVGTPTPSRAQVAAVSGYSVKSSGFDKTLSLLSSAGVITRPSSGTISLIDASMALSMDEDAARARLLSVLGPARRRVLDAFSGSAATREEIAERSQYSNTSSGFDKTLSQLSSIGVVTRPAPGIVDLADWVRALL